MKHIRPAFGGAFIFGLDISVDLWYDLSNGIMFIQWI